MQSSAQLYKPRLNYAIYSRGSVVDGVGGYLWIGPKVLADGKVWPLHTDGSHGNGSRGRGHCRRCWTQGHRP